MVNDLGEAIKPYLKQLYMAVKHDPRATDLRKSMDKEDHDDEHDVTG